MMKNDSWNSINHPNVSNSENFLEFLYILVGTALDPEPPDEKLWDQEFIWDGQHYVAAGLFIVYQITIVIILINLLIAVMNASVSFVCLFYLSTNKLSKCVVSYRYDTTQHMRLKTTQQESRHKKTQKKISKKNYFFSKLFFNKLKNIHIHVVPSCVVSFLCCVDLCRLDSLYPQHYIWGRVNNMKKKSF